MTASARPKATRCRSLAERLAKWLLIGDGCWLWTGTLGDGGYGQVTVAPYTLGRVHRVVYELLIGPIPPGLEPDHLCRTPACARPDHLEPVTHRENIRRAFDRPTCQRGHPWTPETTYRKPDGRRECQPCKKARWALWATQQAEAA